MAVGALLLQNSTILLVCDGLDTIATVTVNGVVVGKSENMFLRYIYNIKSALKVIKSTYVKHKHIKVKHMMFIFI